MVNVTISMDEETARWVRIEAAKAGMSVSRYVGGLLAERRRTLEEAAWEAGRAARLEAGRAFLASPPRELGYFGRAPTREELYDEVLRRHERSRVQEGSDGAFQAEESPRLDQRRDRKGRVDPKRTKPP
ncbi:MAG: hypothetical protein BroJett013_26760 [Alphaproteobacteria bacterium]|nr:MAG: hypothetical protein BroJett013_26760 [Alphaproteobacteria bacterium]